MLTYAHLKLARAEGGVAHPPNQGEVGAHFYNLGVLSGLPKDAAGRKKVVARMVNMCGSFLTIQDEYVYIVHQSANEFLREGGLKTIFPSGTNDVHYKMFSASIDYLLNTQTLQRDIYGLRDPGIPITKVIQPEQDPLAAARYGCVYWVDHLCDSGEARHDDFQDEGSLIQGREGEDSLTLNKLVRDARRFIMSHKWAIENSPLQAYASALVFSPAHSPIRGLFEKEKPTWITVKWGVGDEWSACLQTFEGDETANSVAFSHNSAWLASASNDRTIKIWDVSSGDCLRTLKGRSSYVNSVAFSRDSIWLASASGDQTVKIWDASNGHCLRTLSGHSSSVHSVAFSHDSVRLASASNDRTIKIWDVNSGNCLRTLEGHRYWVHSVTFSHNSVRLASASGDQTVKIWDVSSGECLHTLEGHSNVRSVAFSLDSVWLASASDGSTVKIWNASSGDYVKTLKVGKVSIDATSSYLHTEIGTFAIDASMADMILGVTDSQNPQYQYQGWALSSNREWITYNSKNLVWLPSEYRPLCRAVSGKAIGIGVGSGKLWLFSVGLPNLESVCIDNAVVCSWRRHRR